MELEKRAITLPESLNKKQYFELAQEKLHLSATELSDLLWNTYHPNKFWYIIFGLGVLTAFSIFLFNRYLKKSTH